jgi:hypothetical protein
VRLAAALCGTALSAGGLAACSLLLSTDDLSGAGSSPQGSDASTSDAPAADARPIEADVQPADAGASETSLDAGNPYVLAVLSDAPVLYLRLEESSGVLARDVTGEAKASYYGNFRLGAEGAFPGSRAIELDGGLGGVVALDAFDFSGTKPFTLEAWYRPTGHDEVYRFVTNLDAPKVGGLRQTLGVWTQGGQNGLELERYVDGENRTVWRSLPTIGEFHHVVATYDGATLRLYVDTQLAGASADARPSHAVGDLWFGSLDRYYGTLIGDLDEVAVYDKALPVARIAAHYDAALNQKQQ